LAAEKPGLAADVEPSGWAFGKGAGGDVVIDLIQLVLGQEWPGRSVHAPEAREITLAVLAVGECRLIDHHHLAGRTMDSGEQLKLALGGEVVDGKPAPRRIGGLGPPLQSLDEIAMVELDGEGYALQVLGGEFERGL